MTILYDCTRLVSRRNSPTPTGIDRVDLRYLEEFLATERERIEFVYQREGRLVLLNKNELIRAIKRISDNWRSKSGNNNVIDIRIPNIKFHVKKRTCGKQKVSINYWIKTFINSYTRVRISRPNKALWGRVKWINSLHTSIKVPILIFAGIMAGSIWATWKTIQGLVYFTKNIDRYIKNDSDTISNYVSKDVNRLLNFSRVKGLKIEYWNISHNGIDNINVFTDLYTAFGVKFIFFIHDIIPIDYPEYVRHGDSEKHENRIKTVFLFASTIYVNSEYTRERLTQYGKSIGDKFDHSNIHVRLIGVEDHFLNDNIGKGILDGEPYFVILGTIEPRKNHLTILNMIRAIVEEVGIDQCPYFILIGKRGWEIENLVALLDRCNKIKPKIIEMSGLSDKKLLAIVKGSRALLFPSFVEGWGMPLVEALAIKTPVICSDIPVFHEAGQEIPDYIDPIDSISWKKTIMEYASPVSNQRSKQLGRINNYVVPSWDKHFLDKHDNREFPIERYIET